MERKIYNDISIEGMTEGNKEVVQKVGRIMKKIKKWYMVWMENKEMVDGKEGR